MSRACFRSTICSPAPTRSTVELQGFKKHVEDNVVLQISETRNLAIVLEVGTLQESISVVAESPRLNTSDANMGLVVDQQRLASLPLIHGDPYKIMGLATGLAHTGDQRLDRPFEPTHVIGYAMDGTRGNRSDLLIDGLPSTATANANEVIATYVPPSDLVQEFKVQTATFDSQFGNTEGGVTSMVIKSGTNRLHGSAYYFAEPSSWGANDFFGKARRPGEGREQFEPARRHARRPVILARTRPSTWSATNESRTSARVSTSPGTRGFRPRRSATATSPRTRRNITIYDPLTRAPTGTGQFVGQPFTGNVIPANRINPMRREGPGVLQPAQELRRDRQHLSTRPCRRRRRPTTPSPAASTTRSPPATRCSCAGAGTSATATTTTISRPRPRAPCSSSSRTRPSSTTCTCSTPRPC